MLGNNLFFLKFNEDGAELHVITVVAGVYHIVQVYIHRQSKHQIHINLRMMM